MARAQGNAKRLIKYVPVVGPRLKKLLAVVFLLFALLVVNSVYLLTVTVAGPQYQNWFYHNMFLLHLVMGLALITPVVVFGIVHIRNARNRPNKRAIRMGYTLFTAACIIFISGLVLMRVDLLGFRFEVNEAVSRSIAYWAHVLAPVAAIWLFILHRLAGRRIKWGTGLTWASAATVFAVGMLILQAQDPRAWNVAGPKSGEQYFFPSLSRTSTGNFIPARVLANDQYCQECHTDIYDDWYHSAHRLSSFNNPAYLFSVRQTRQAMFDRDGDVQGSRFCAGCHDPVPFFSGAFDDPKFDDPKYDLASDVTANAGITCTTCHSIVHVGSTSDATGVIGNGDYTIDEPVHYPFAFSENPLLRWVNRQLVKAKPEFHKATFLKPDIHRSTQFCGTCHKVHLPPDLNAYKWLRGQDHYDAFWLSGVSGQGVASFYYPPAAEANCNKCHMPLETVSDRPNFSARIRDDSGEMKTVTHQFPSANTGIVHLLRDQLPDPDGAIAAHEKFLEGVMRVDVFALRDGGEIDGALTAPIRPQVPTLTAGETYLLEAVIRTMKMGHVFTQGTADSNEVWMDVTVTASAADQPAGAAGVGEDSGVIGRSGGMRDDTNEVDPWSHFVNAFVIDRDGNRINRRNAQDIFIALYNNQIPPGAADIVHYRLDVPDDLSGSLTVDVKLQYRKFDTEYMALVAEDPNYINDLPIITLARDTVTFPVSAATAPAPGNAPAPGSTNNPEPSVPEWMRWNDYGIGLLRNGQFRQAEEAFAEVEALGRPDGPINLARVYIQEGRVATDAPLALQRARNFVPAAPAWSVLWFSGEVEKLNGNLDAAIGNFRQIVEGGFEQALGRGFDFSKDYNLLNELGVTIYERARQERGTERRDRRETLLRDAVGYFRQALDYDPENVTAHFNLGQIYRDLGEITLAEQHAALHAYYRLDDNARDRAIAAARIRYPAANHAAENVVIIDLHRPGAYDLPESSTRVARND